MISMILFILCPLVFSCLNMSYDITITVIHDEYYLKAIYVQQEADNLKTSLILWRHFTSPDDRFELPE